jgi:hypothetical protein
MLLGEAGRPLIPDGVTFHSLRRCYATLAAEAGIDQAYTMRQIGHRSAALTLEVYTLVGDRRHGGNAHLGERLLGAQDADWALIGHQDDPKAAVSTSAREAAAGETPASERVPGVGGAGLEPATSCL